MANDLHDLRNLKIGVIWGGTLHRKAGKTTAKKILRSLLKQGFQAELIDTAEHDFVDRVREIDVAYIAQYGKHGDDGTLQGFLATLGIPYTGSGVTGSTISVDKILSKKLFQFHQIPTPHYYVIDPFQEIQQQCKIILHELTMPVMVKPALEGSSIGVSLVEDPMQLQETILASQNYSPLFVEEYIDGQLLTVGIIGCGESLKVLPVLETELLAEGKVFDDLEAKSYPGFLRQIVPARLAPAQKEIIEHIALQAFQALGCYGLGRVDMKLSSQGQPFVLEVNSLPGLSELSDLPVAAQAAGINFDDLILAILKTALNRPAHIV